MNKLVQFDVIATISLPFSSGPVQNGVQVMEVCQPDGKKIHTSLPVETREINWGVARINTIYPLAMDHRKDDSDNEDSEPIVIEMLDAVLAVAAPAHSESDKEDATQTTRFKDNKDSSEPVKTLARTVLHQVNIIDWSIPQIGLSNEKTSLVSSINALHEGVIEATVTGTIQFQSKTTATKTDSDGDTFDETTMEPLGSATWEKTGHDDRANAAKDQGDEGQSNGGIAGTLLLAGTCFWLISQMPCNSQSFMFPLAFAAIAYYFHIKRRYWISVVSMVGILFSVLAMDVNRCGASRLAFPFDREIPRTIDPEKLLIPRSATPKPLEPSAEFTGHIEKVAMPSRGSSSRREGTKERSAENDKQTETSATCAMPHETERFNYDGALDDFMHATGERAEKLEAYAKRMAKLGKEYVIQITGHTDQLKNGRRALEIAQAKAEEMKAYLIEKSGISAERITTKSAGGLIPVSDTDTRLNRRIEIRTTCKQ